MPTHIPLVVKQLALACHKGADNVYALHDALLENGLECSAKHYVTHHSPAPAKCCLTEYLAGISDSLYTGHPCCRELGILGEPCKRCGGKRDWHDALTGNGKCLECNGVSAELKG